MHTPQYTQTRNLKRAAHQRRERRTHWDPILAGRSADWHLGFPAQRSPRSPTSSVPNSAYRELSSPAKDSRGSVPPSFGRERPRLQIHPRSPPPLFLGEAGRCHRPGGRRAGGHYLFKDAVMSYLDVRRRVGDCLKHPRLVRKGREGPRTNLGGRNLSHPEYDTGETVRGEGGGG